MGRGKNAALLFIGSYSHGDDGDLSLRRTVAMFVSTTPTRDTPYPKLPTMLIIFVGSRDRLWIVDVISRFHSLTGSMRRTVNWGGLGIFDLQPSPATQPHYNEQQRAEETALRTDSTAG